MNRIARVLLLVIATAGLLVPALPAAAGGGCHGAPLTDERADEVKAFGACFTPTVARIGVGDTVTFFNGDAMEHNVTGVPQPFTALDRTGDRLLPDATGAFRFDKAGVYPYVCTLHPTMAGAIVVGDGESAAGTSGGTANGKGADDKAVAAGAPAAGAAAAPTSAMSAWRPAAAIIAALALAALVAWVLQRAGRRRTEPAPHLG